VIPTQGRDHPGRGRRRHRLRHDGGAHVAAASDLPDNLKGMRSAIERAVPHGRTDNGGRATGRVGTCPRASRTHVEAALRADFDTHHRKTPARLDRGNTASTSARSAPATTSSKSASTRRSASGSCCTPVRAASATASAPLHRTREEGHAPAHRQPARPDLAYFEEGAEHFDDYVEAVGWAQRFARTNRDLMMQASIAALRARDQAEVHRRRRGRELPPQLRPARDHFGASVLVTRKGAVRAGKGELGIIPGSMGARAYIVRGKGNEDSFHSCSHGAGRAMSRNEAQRRFTSRPGRAPPRASSAARTPT
jgi:tRNA-splicing ligase RtcB